MSEVLVVNSLNTTEYGVSMLFFFLIETYLLSQNDLDLTLRYLKK